MDGSLARISACLRPPLRQLRCQHPRRLGCPVAGTAICVQSSHSTASVIVRKAEIRLRLRPYVRSGVVTPALSHGFPRPQPHGPRPQEQSKAWVRVEEPRREPSGTMRRRGSARRARSRPAATSTSSLTSTLRSDANPTAAATTSNISHSIAPAPTSTAPANQLGRSSREHKFAPDRVPDLAHMRPSHGRGISSER